MEKRAHNLCKLIKNDCMKFPLTIYVHKKLSFTIKKPCTIYLCKYVGS